MFLDGLVVLPKVVFCQKYQKRLKITKIPQNTTFFLLIKGSYPGRFLDSLSLNQATKLAGSVFATDDFFGPFFDHFWLFLVVLGICGFLVVFGVLLYDRNLDRVPGPDI